MSNTPPSFQLGSGASSRRAPVARSGLRSTSASSRAPTSSTPFAAISSSTVQSLQPFGTTPARTFAALLTAELPRGAKRSEPDDGQGTEKTFQDGDDSRQQHLLGHSAQGHEEDARVSPSDRMEERMEAISARLAQRSQETLRPLRRCFKNNPTTHATNRLKQSRRSNAARVFLGADDQTAYDCTNRPQPDQAAATTHFAPRFDILNPLTTPGGAHLTAGPGTSEGLRPRRFTSVKPSDIGLYEPDKGSDTFSWWRGVVQYQAYSGATEAEVFSGLPDCFSKWPRQWLDELIPRPATLKEFRNRAFQAFMRDATLVQDDVDHRKFKPQEESLETYLFDKYKLVSELQVSKAMAAGHTDFDNPNPESARILMTIKDAIQTVHNGLPADWRTLLNVYRQEEDWPAYRSQLLGSEQQTR
ncbi:hypothetical protein CF328_g3343 [Tilletia controversa]|nr:hypothetical protein CF328_g3343 [Tilletia controversa]